MDHPQYTPNPRKNKHLTFTERVKIEIMTGEGKSAYSIAKVLNRPINTVINEIRRGTVDQIKKGTRVHKNKKKLGDSIETRPSQVATREEFGHWEIDTVIGSRSKEDESLLVMVERKDRNVLIRKIASKTAEAVEEEIECLKGKYGSCFNKVFKSFTSDNGSEFSLLSSLKKYGVGVYFAHPYSAYERGTNENLNGLIRRFIPKEERVSNYSHEAIFRVEEWINSLPRKILGYKTPEKLFE